MKSLMNFSDSALTRSEMINVKGGCGLNVYGNVKSYHPRGMTKAAAKKEAAQINSWNQPGLVAYWCCSQC